MNLRLPIAVVAAGGLLATSAGSLAAQEDDAPQPPAPEEFTACVNEGPLVEGSIEQVALPDGETTIERSSATWRQPATDVSDPRLDGTWFATADDDTFSGPGSDGLIIGTWTRRIENDEGAWQGSHQTIDFPDDEVVGGWPGLYVMIGEGAYEGLTAFMVSSEEESVGSACPNTRGYIIEGSVPAAPEQHAAGGADAAGTSELVAKMHVVFHGAGGHQDWLYLYTDGRLLTDAPPGWSERSEQRLTPDGVELVRAEIISSGLFDPEQPPPGSRQSEEATRIQVRNGDRLVDVGWVPDREWSPDFLRVVERLRSLESWLPASAWADAEATTWLPDRYAICTGGPGSEPPEWSDVMPLLPAAAAALLDAAPRLDEFTREIDPAAYEDFFGGDESRCFDLTTEQAQSLAASLNAELTPQESHALGIPIDAPTETIVLLFMPILPHGVPECACLG
jgi:hypothetical protein